MRVISGQAKGRRLKSVPGDTTRPITDRAKTSLFNILRYDIVDSRFLDLFAGTGQVGIEALSWGAEQAVFVERARPACAVIHENLAHTDLAGRAQVEQADVFEFLRRPPQPYDYIYIAPPQYHDLWSKTLLMVDANTDWLMDDGWVVVQIDPSEFRDLDLQSLILFDQRTYGGVMLCFYGIPEED